MTKTKTPAAALNEGFQLMRLVEQREQTETEIRESVARMVTLGASWTDVAVALGTSKQAAHQRYGAAVKQLTPEKAQMVNLR